jgi:chorismate lyase/3-hydroxybenzoate synthase
MPHSLRWLIDLDSRPQIDLAKERKLLAAIAFDSSKRALPFTLDLPPLEPLSLVVRAHGKVRGGELSGAPLAMDDELMIAELKLSEVDQGSLKNASQEAYRRMLSIAQATGYPHILRTWNYFSSINVGEGDQERYKQFCSGRARAIGDAWDAGEPAATVIGRPARSRWLHVLWLAAKNPGQAIDNPRQTAPRDYPKQYGQDAPRFARGTLWKSPTRGSILLISGTAAVVAAESKHDGELMAQLDECVRNLKSVLAEAAVRAARPGRFDAGTVLIAYVRQETKQFDVQKWLKQQFPECQVAVFHGEVCRKELLVEIEAIHYFDPPR